MLVCELARRFNKDIKVQVRHISDDELCWEGHIEDLDRHAFHGATCVPDLIKPSYQYSENIGNIDFEIYFHYDNEYPQTVLSSKSIKRIYGKSRNTPGCGVITGRNKLNNNQIKFI